MTMGSVPPEEQTESLPPAGLAAELFVGSAEVGHSNSILGVSLCWL